MTYDGLERHGLLLRSNEGALDKKFVFALGIQRWLLWEGL